MAVKEEIVSAIADALRRLGHDADALAIVVERPREAAHGDLSTPVAMSIAKRLKQNPLAIAEGLAAAIQLPEDLVSGVEAVRPGFVNFRLALPVLQRTVPVVLAEGDRYGSSRDGAGRKVQVEYVSANPTGPLVIVSARAASVGNCLLNLLDACGYQTQGEYYVNDFGKQVEALGESLRFRAKERLNATAPGESIEQYQYPGGYLTTIATETDEATARRWLEPGAGSAELGRFASARLLESIRNDMAAFGARFDNYFLESSLHPDAVRATFDRLVASGHTYAEDGAVFFRSTTFGDDKDRVIRKADGEPTYFLADIAYHADKLARGYERAIGLLGPDHHGHVPRMRAAMTALGAPDEWLEIIMVGWVRLMEGGNPISMSKRSGEFVTMRELIDDVGPDVAKYFFLMRRANSPLDFDLTLARKQSDENPVYYVQYAHARVCSVFGQGFTPPDAFQLERLSNEKELQLARRLEEYPDVIAVAAKELAPHSVAFYLRELAADFHSYYNAERILVEDEALRAARLALCAAVRQTLANGLALLGVSAPEKM